MARSHHPELVATTLDLLAGASKPWATSDLSIAVTSAMRRFVQRGGAMNEQVMTWNAADSAGHWEVTGATIVAILERQPTVTMTGVARRLGGRREKHWATTANAERWAREREEREAALVEADTRFAIREGEGYVWVVDSDRFGKVDTPADTAVVKIDTEAVPLDVARDLAQRAKRALVRQAVGAPQVTT